MFNSIIATVGMMLIYMILGFVLCKSGKATVGHAKSMSALLIYILNPAMLINSFLSLEYSHESFIKIGKFCLFTLIAQLLFFAILYVILNRKYADSKYRILTIGGVLGNVGFMGLPIIVSVFPNDPIVMCYSSINVMSMNLIVFTLGVFMITNDRRYISLKGAILNPTTLSIIVAVPLFILKVNFPEPIENGIRLLAKMVVPMCMVIIGMRLSASDLRKVFSRGFVYVSAALKLVVFPIFVFIIVQMMPFLDNTAKVTAVVLAMTPSGAVIESIAEMYECEQEFAANVVMLSTVLSVITIPIMAWILC